MSVRRGAVCALTVGAKHICGVGCMTRELVRQGRRQVNRRLRGEPGRSRRAPPDRRSAPAAPWFAAQPAIDLPPTLAYKLPSHTPDPADVFRPDRESANGPPPD